MSCIEIVDIHESFSSADYEQTGWKHQIIDSRLDAHFCFSKMIKKNLETEKSSRNQTNCAHYNPLPGTSHVTNRKQWTVFGLRSNTSHTVAQYKLVIYDRSGCVSIVFIFGNERTHCSGQFLPYDRLKCIILELNYYMCGWNVVYVQLECILSELNYFIRG